MDVGIVSICVGDNISVSECLIMNLDVIGIFSITVKVSVGFNVSVGMRRIADSMSMTLAEERLTERKLNVMIRQTLTSLHILSINILLGIGQRKEGQ